TCRCGPAAATSATARQNAATTAWCETSAAATRHRIRAADRNPVCRPHPVWRDSRRCIPVRVVFAACERPGRGVNLTQTVGAPRRCLQPCLDRENTHTRQNLKRCSSEETMSTPASQQIPENDTEAQ